MAKPQDLTGQRFGKLLAVELVPYGQRRNSYNRREWVCRCDCGTEKIIEQRNIISNFHTQSCGCIRVKAHLVATSKMPLTLEYVDQFEDYERYAFLHKTFVKVHPQPISIDFYYRFIEKFYSEPQFNRIYHVWLNENVKHSTYYDWYKPSLDHIIPKSKGGKVEVSNYQFLTVFENLNKRDMTMEEWAAFKKSTNTHSELYIEYLMQGGKN